MLCFLLQGVYASEDEVALSQLKLQKLQREEEEKSVKQTPIDNIVTKSDIELFEAAKMKALKVNIYSPDHDSVTNMKIIIFWEDDGGAVIVELPMKLQARKPIFKYMHLISKIALEIRPKG